MASHTSPTGTAAAATAANTTATSSSRDKADESEYITILGFGSLLSERSSRMTFPDLINFRLGRVPNYRRVFGHATSIFFQRGIANMETKEMASLSAEYVKKEEEHDDFPGFICTIFEVPNRDMMQDGVPSMEFLLREEEFDIKTVPYIDLTMTTEEHDDDDDNNGAVLKEGGVLCCASTDDAYLQRWGPERFEQHFTKYGIDTIWGWNHDSGLRPCATYLRHCTLAAQAMGTDCYNSFLDETVLVDRTTTLRTYLEANPHVMATEPPPDMLIRYGG